jgi:penicillin-binding protein 1C
MQSRQNSVTGKDREPRRAAVRASRFGTLLLRSLLFGLLACAVLCAIAWFAFPFPAAELDRYPAATVLLDRTGGPLRVRLGPGDTDCRLPYRADPERDWICRAVVAAEDRRFWSHPGVDLLALGRAIGQNLRRGRVVSGASTLSTQVVRLLHPRRRTLPTKAVEMFRALQLEALLDKRQILEQYLNRAPFGANTVGIEAASRRYFARAPQDLSLAEAALLAGLPQSPSRLRPDRYPERARRRAVYVLDRMEACGAISAAQRDAARTQPVPLRRDAYPFRAPHFCELALETLPDSPGHRPAVVTTLDPALQRLAEETLRRRAAAHRADGVYGGAVVVIEVRSGAVRALAGSPDYADAAHAGQVNGAAARRPPGSTLKPFAYALAVDRGRLTPATVLADVPRTFRDLAPANFDGEFLGLVPARAALAMSLNIPALTLVEEAGVETFLRTLRQAGLDTLDRGAGHYGLSLALGDAPVRLLDLANAYACFARGGEWQPWQVVETRTARAAECAGRRVFSSEAAWLLAEMLCGDERAMDAAGHRADARLPRFAWKTGTSSGFRDAWAVGFNPAYAIGVWIGNPDGAPSPSLVGARAAAPVLWEIVRGLYPANDAPWFERPPGVARRAVCAASGLPPGPDCPCTETSWFVPGVSSPRPCGVHVRRTSADGRAAVAETWPPAVAAFLQRRAPPAAEPAGAEDEAPRLVTPQPGAVFRLVDGLADAQRLPLKAACRAAGPLYWFVDDRLVAATPATESAAWPLARGRHVVVCAVPSGRSARAEIVVE